MPDGIDFRPDPLQTTEPGDKPLIYLVNPWHHEIPEDGYMPPPSDCLGMNYIAAVLRQDGHDVAMCDAYITREKPGAIADKIYAHAGRRPLILGFSFMCPSQLDHAEVIVEGLRRRGATLRHVMAGGQFAATCHKSLLENYPSIFDSVVHGEAEHTARELVAALSNGAPWQGVPGVASRGADGIIFQRRHENPELESLPWPARDTLPELRAHDGVANIDTSRGCESNCTFCMSREILRHTASKERWRSRSPADVVSEMAWIKRTSGIDCFNFTDENTIGNIDHRDRLYALADEIENRGLEIQFNTYVRAQDVDEDLIRRLHEVGLASVFIGIESFWQPTLDRLNKRVSVQENLDAIRKIRGIEGLRFYFGLMTFHPWVTIEEIRHNLRVLREEVLGIPLTGPEMLKRLLQVMLIYKGTPSYMMAKRDGLIRQESAFDQGPCTYVLPEQPLRLLRFIKTALMHLMQPQHKLFLAATARENAADPALQQAVWELNCRVERHILDATDRFALALEEEADDTALQQIGEESLARTDALVEAIAGTDLGDARARRNVDQPDAHFLGETERVGA